MVEHPRNLFRDRDVNAAAESSWRGKPITQNQREVLLQTGDYTVGDLEQTDNPDSRRESETESTNSVEG